jgi:16S rRNA (uracil1498-N3)-methyltransferase
VADKPRRLFAPELPEQGGQIALPLESAHHARVLRLPQGARVRLFDGRSGEADATISALTRDAIACIAEPRVALPRPSPALHLILGLPKHGKLEDMTRMLTELGVGAIHLLRSERSVPKGNDASTRLDRLTRIALEACAQSGQPRAPDIHPPSRLTEILPRVDPGAHRVVFWEDAGAAPLERALPPASPADVWTVIGPEGGLSEAEVRELEAHGFVQVSLGPAVLRVQTAAPVIAALLLARMGRLS